MTDSPEYKITMSEHIEPSYEDGFADGYSRAWQECWDYMIAEIRKINAENEKKETK